MITIRQDGEDIVLDPKKLTKIYCEHGGNPNNVIFLDKMVLYFPCSKCWNAIVGAVMSDIFSDALKYTLKKAVKL